MISEPVLTAAYLAVFGVLLTVAVLSSRLSTHAGVPAVLVFLVIGMLAGSEGLGGIEFANYELTFRIGMLALALILFDGGLNTSYDLVRRAAWSGLILATAGVVLTAAVVAGGAWLIGFSPVEAALLGVIVSSTDAAAVFSILRGSGLQLRRRVQATLDLESGLNDPLAVILTLAFTSALASGTQPGVGLFAGLVVQIAVGALFGIGLGYLGRWLLHVAGPLSSGLYPVLTLAIALLSFALPTLVWGSGFLAVYLTGIVLGNGRLPYRAHLTRAHDFIAWLSQVSMFLAMGLLAFPSELAGATFEGLIIALLLALVARPLAVFACLSPLRFPFREQLYIGWVGLRGAVPIILATFPLLEGIDVGGRIFNIVFFVVLVSVLLQGGTTRWAGRRLGMERPAPPFTPVALELHTSATHSPEILSFYVRPGLLIAGMTLAELTLPERSAVVLVVRGEQPLAPHGDVALQPGDHVYVLCDPADRPLMRLLFGHEDDSD